MFKLFKAKNRQSSVADVSGEGIVRVSAQSLISLHHGAESLSLKARKIRALQSGGYVSPFKGRGMEFDEVRPYMAGDDVRTLDWRVTARTGRAHTKLFREERERAIFLCTDLSRSMFFATQGAYKSVRVAQAAALLGWSAIHHGDRLGGLIYSDDDHLELRPKRGKQSLLHFLNKLAAHESWDGQSQHLNQTAMQQSLLRLRRVAQPGSLIFLLSDFVSLDAQCASHMAQLSRHNDLVLVSIHDQIETDLPPAGRYRVSDGDKFITLDTAPDNVREHYQQRYQWRRGELQRLCRRHGMHLIEFSTADDPLAALQQGLGGRR